MTSAQSPSSALPTPRLGQLPRDVFEVGLPELPTQLLDAFCVQICPFAASLLAFHDGVWRLNLEVKADLTYLTLLTFVCGAGCLVRRTSMPTWGDGLWSPGKLGTGTHALVHACEHDALCLRAALEAGQCCHCFFSCIPKPSGVAC